jgi:hypothetical protein
MESLPFWPEDSDIIRPIPVNTVTDRIGIKLKKEGDNEEECDNDNNNNNINNNNANVRSMEAYTRVIESVVFNKSKKELFPSINEVLLQWKIYGNALKIVENSIHNAGNNDSDNNSDSDDDNEDKRIREREIEKNKGRDKDREKEKEKNKRTQVLKRREEQDKEELKNNNSNNLKNSGSIGLLNRLDEIVDIKKNVIVTNKDKNKDRNEEKEECDVVFKVVQEQISTLRFYTVGSSIESIMKNI